MEENVIYFFPNGNSAVFQYGEQVPKLQEAWIQLFFKHIIEKGYNPCDFIFKMPNGRDAQAIKCEDGSYNWKFI